MKVEKEQDVLKQLSNDKSQEITRLKTRLEGLNNTVLHLEKMKKDVETLRVNDKKKYDEECGIYATKLKHALEDHKDSQLLKTQIKELTLLRETHVLEKEHWKKLENEYEVRASVYF